MVPLAARASAWVVVMPKWDIRRDVKFKTKQYVTYWSKVSPLSVSLWGSRWSACLPRLGLSAWLPASTGVTEPRGWVFRKQHVKVSIVPRHGSRPMERTRQAPHKYSLSTDPRAPTAHDSDRSEGLRSSRRVKQALGTLQSRRGLGGLRARGNWRPPLALRPDDQWAKSHRHIVKLLMGSARNPKLRPKTSST